MRRLTAAFALYALYFMGPPLAMTVLFAFITGRLLGEGDWATALVPGVISVAMAVGIRRGWRKLQGRFAEWELTSGARDHLPG